MKMTNRWNTLIYRLWAPVYDATVEHFFSPGRRQALQALALQPGERVLLVGVGTGADLPLLPPGVQAVGIDLSPAMLSRARGRLPRLENPVSLIRADAQLPLFVAQSFDTVILNLILSVVPDGGACLREALRALKPGGRMVIFDKFLPDQSRLGLARRLINLFSTLFGTDITRRFGDLAAGSPCQVIQDDPSLMRGMYRVILLQKYSPQDEPAEKFNQPHLLRTFHQ